MILRARATSWVLTAVLVCALTLGTCALSGCSDDGSEPTGSTGVETTSTSTGSASATAPTGESDGGGGPSGPAEPVRLKDVDPALLTGDFVVCPDCHSLLDQPGATSPAIVATFDHSLHFANGAKCADCHAAPTHTEAGIQPPPMDKCFACHSQSDPAAPPGACEACHPADFPLVPSSHGDPEWLPAAEIRGTVKGKHTRSMEDAQKECGVCHDVPGFCKGCHKVDMPHPAGWQDVHQQQAKEQGLSGCNMCHTGQQECSTCHHKGYTEGGTPWIELHPTVVQTDGPDACTKCHSTSTCAHCHVTGEYVEY